MASTCNFFHLIANLTVNLRKGLCWFCSYNEDGLQIGNCKMISFILRKLLILEQTNKVVRRWTIKIKEGFSLYHETSCRMVLDVVLKLCWDAYRLSVKLVVGCLLGSAR